jgi:hypothetical protein
MKEDKTDGHVAWMGEMRKLCRLSVGKPEGKRPVARPRPRWENNIRWILRKQVGSCGLDASGSGYGPVEGSGERGNEPPGSIKGGKFLSS